MASLFDSDCSDSEDDCDYVPRAGEPSCSESDEDYEEPKRQVMPTRGGKANVEDDSDKSGEKIELSKEKQKKHVDNLWKDFLDDTKPVGKGTDELNESATVLKETKDIPCNLKVTVAEEYEFAGETVTVSKEVDRNSVDAQEVEETGSIKTSVSEKPAAGAAPKRKGGLAAVVGALGKKKQKMSTLEKSSLDWKSFKKEEGIEEELKTHNKGKDGFLERQAFLQRSDLRQFEIEKNLRLSRVARP